MDYGRKSGWLLLLLAVLLSPALLGGCGSSEKEAPIQLGSSGSAATIGIDGCAGCHSDVVAAWMTSKHANAEEGVQSAGTPKTTDVASCATNCHDPNFDSAKVSLVSYIGTVARPVVGCEACHGGGSLHDGVGPISRLSNTAAKTIGSVAVSGQFAMCTSCHELLDSLGTGTVTATHAVASSVSPTGKQFTIADTHFATAGNWSAGANSQDITGYAVDYGSETACTDCHNPHKTADINKEWANSAHAEKGAWYAWAHYNWSCDSTNCGGAFGDRATCQRCHTTTGFAAYIDALEEGNTGFADELWIGSQRAVAYSAGFKPEMLTCKGCHTNNRGTLRNPGAYKAAYMIPVGGFPPPAISPTLANVPYQYPDIGASNICMPCHTGRGSGRAISSLKTASTDTWGFSKMSLPDGHYLTAGGTMFKGTAYEYAGRSYGDPASFKHSKIGTSAVPNTGNGGPCIGCHMERPGLSGNHRFQPISKDAAGKITNVSSEICFNCHAGSGSSLAEVTEREREDYEYALQAFEHQLVISSPTYSFITSYPYFAQTYHLSPGDSDITGNTTGKKNIGAAYNFSMLHHEPGAYVHNSRYVKRIIYDSIDWIDNNQLDYSVGNTLNTGSLPASSKEGAMKYLLNQVYYDVNGTIISDPSERP